MSKLMGIAFAASLIAQAGYAAENDKVVGTWKLVSLDVETQTLGKKSP
jgi:hypothetical protein